MNIFPEVHSQRARLRIDTDRRSVEGWTELHVTPAKDSHKIGLHAYGLSILSVAVDGSPAEYEHRPQHVHEELPDSVLSVQNASPEKMLAAVADAAYYQYERTLQREKDPELIITHVASKEAQPQQAVQLPQQEQQQDQQQLVQQDQPAATSSMLVIRVEYEVVQPACGVHFHGCYAATANQVRRTSAWLPCLDVPSAAVDFQLELTVRAEEVAVGPGRLVKQTAAISQPLWRTFHYDLPIPCAPCQLGFAVGPFAVMPSPASHGRPSYTTITHFAPPHPSTPLLPTSPLVNGEIGVEGAAFLGGGDAVLEGAASAAVVRAKGEGLLANTAKFFSLPMALYESLLGQRFPLPSMQQVFVPGEGLLEEVEVALGLQVLSSRFLLNIHSIEQSLEARRVIARALARQWFGVFMRPAAPADAWLLEGLAGWLEEQYIKKYMGNNELQYRRWRERAAISMADNGDAPPLSWRGPATPSPWGQLYGTQGLDPSELRSLKATAVIGMLERRAGDMFKKHLERIISAACHPDPASPGNPRLLDTMAFLIELGKAGSFRKEIPAFAERWVYRRGVPHITAGFLYHRRKNVLELAIRQSGSEAAKIAADMAERVAKHEGTGAGVIKVVVRESEVTTEHPVHLGGNAAVLEELKVNPEIKKPAGRRGMRRKRGEGEEGEGEGDTQLGEAASQAALAAQHAIQWVRIDPGGEWLCSSRVLQPERCWLAQLQLSRDVVAQAEAVQGLLDQAQSTGSARSALLGALSRVLDSSATYYRVRQDAAMALAAITDAEGNAPGLDVLLKFYKSRHWDMSADPPCPRPTPVTDPAEYLVAQAVVTAIASCRDRDGATQTDALLFLMEELDSYQSRMGGYDDSGLVAAMCEGLGSIHTEPELAESYLAMLEDQLMRDAVAPSPSCIVGCACLAAMAQLATGKSGSQEIRSSVQDTLARCLDTPRLPLPLKLAAHAAAIQLLAASGGAEAALHYGVRAVGAQLDHAENAMPTEDGSVQRAVTAWRSTLDAPSAARIWEEVVWAAGGALGELKMATLRATASILNAGHNCRLRHAAFMALRRLQRQPPTLYQPPPLEDEDMMAIAVHPAASHGVTRRTGAAPAPSTAAPATTHNSRGITKTKRVTIKLPLRTGTGAGPGGGVFSGGFGPEPSGEGVTMSDGRAVGEPMSPTTSEVLQPIPWEATRLSPVRPSEEEEVGTKAPQVPSREPTPTEPQPEAAADAAGTEPPSSPLQPLAAGPAGAGAGSLQLAAPSGPPQAAAPAPPTELLQEQQQEILHAAPSRSFKFRIKAHLHAAPIAAPGPAADAAPPTGAELAPHPQQVGRAGSVEPQSREPSPGPASLKRRSPGDGSREPSPAPLLSSKLGPSGGSREDSGLKRKPGAKGSGSTEPSPAPAPRSKLGRGTPTREPSPLQKKPDIGDSGSREPSPAPQPASAAAAKQGKQKKREASLGLPTKGAGKKQGAETAGSQQKHSGSVDAECAKREKTPQLVATDGDEPPPPPLDDVLAAFMQAGAKSAGAEQGSKPKPRKRKQASMSPAPDSQPHPAAPSDVAAAPPEAILISRGVQPSAKPPRPSLAAEGAFLGGDEGGQAAHSSKQQWPQRQSASQAGGALASAAAGSSPPEPQGAMGSQHPRKAGLMHDTMLKVIQKGQKQMQQNPSWAQRALKGGPASAQPPPVPAAGTPLPGAGGGPTASAATGTPSAGGTPSAHKPLKIKLKVKPFLKPPPAEGGP